LQTRSCSSLRKSVVSAESCVNFFPFRLNEINARWQPICFFFSFGWPFCVTIYRAFPMASPTPQPAYENSKLKVKAFIDDRPYYPPLSPRSANSRFCPLELEGGWGGPPRRNDCPDPFHKAQTWESAGPSILRLVLHKAKFRHGSTAAQEASGTSRLGFARSLDGASHFPPPHIAVTGPVVSPEKQRNEEKKNQDGAVEDPRRQNYSGEDGRTPHPSPPTTHTTIPTHIPPPPQTPAPHRTAQHRPKKNKKTHPRLKPKRMRRGVAHTL